MEGQEEAVAPVSTVASEETEEMVRSLTLEERERVSLLQELVATAEQPNYGKRQQVVAQKLGITDRSVRRLLGQLREEGVGQVAGRERSDRGAARIDKEWQQLIVRTYHDGRMGDQTRLGRWEAGRIAQLALLGGRELDLCLMRREQRQKSEAVPISPPTLPPAPPTPADAAPIAPPTPPPAVEAEQPKKPVPYVRVVDYEQMKREAGLL